MLKNFKDGLIPLRMVARLFFVLGLCSCCIVRAEINNLQSNDPWESFNRGVFSFNEGFDQYFFRPVAVAYDSVMPRPANIGVSNFLGNTLEVNTMLNSLLQAKGKNFGLSLARFSINLTVGFFGLFDVASELGIQANKEDFGQTFAVWGVGQGPYLVLPFIGPSNVRDALLYYPDVKINPLITDNVRLRNTSFGLFLVDQRADLLQSEKLVSGDKYIFLRDAYLHNRASLIADGALEYTFGDDINDEEDWLEDDN